MTNEQLIIGGGIMVVCFLALIWGVLAAGSDEDDAMEEYYRNKGERNE